MTEKDINIRISQHVAAYRKAYKKSKSAEGKDQEVYKRQMKRCIRWINKLRAKKRKLQENC